MIPQCSQVSPKVPTTSPGKCRWEVLVGTLDASETTGLTCQKHSSGSMLNKSYKSGVVLVV